MIRSLRSPLAFILICSLFCVVPRAHAQEFGKFFLAKLYGFEITFPEKECEVAFEALDWPRWTFS